MAERTLRQFLVAAGDDPVLAAWAKVIHEYKVGPECEVPPYEHWQTFQEFFSEGLLSPVEYDSADIKRLFFSGHRPEQGMVQGVLNNVKLLPCHNDFSTEKSMSQAKPPMSPFSNSAAIAKSSPSPSELAKGPSRHELRSGRSSQGLSAFQPNRETAIRPAPQVDAFAKPEAPAALACTTNVDSKLYMGNFEINGNIVCCGRPLQPIEDGGDIIPPDELPHGDDFAMHEYMFHCECPTCESIYHCTVGKPIPRDSY